MGCKWLQVVLPIIILIFVFWQTTYSKWIIVIAAVIQLLGAIACSETCGTDAGAKPVMKKPTKKKKKK
ncbi:MAG: hypothetical protein ABIG28_03205 [archaeon]